VTPYPPTSPVYGWPLLQGSQINDWRDVVDALLAVEETMAAVAATAGGISQAAADLRYLLLTGGSLSGSLAITGNLSATGSGSFGTTLTVAAQQVKASATAGNVLVWNPDGFYVPDPAGASAGTVWISFVVDGGGSAITTGQKGHFAVPAGEIVEVALLANASGSIVLDLWKDTYANYPPVVGDSICASAKPTLASAIKAQDTTLTGWTTTLADGDLLAVNVDSAATVTRVTLALRIVRS
jgi:hypothetical protein